MACVSPSVRAVLSAVSVCLCGIADAAGGRDRTTHPEREPFALVELFTSEGCSSCPPAERLLNRLDAEGRKAGSRVFVLAFHVDYWNRLGWVDRFSDPAYSLRQNRYARAFQQNRIYTPQMIVNGTTEFVGSDAARVRRTLRAALDRQPSVGLDLSAAVLPHRRSARIDYRINGHHKPAGLFVAVVENHLTTEVARGENRGRHLRHDGVVRSLRRVELGASEGSVEVDLSVAESDAVAVVAFVQADKSMSVLAAERVDLFTPE